VVATVRRDLRTPPAPPVLDLGNPHSPSFEKLAEAQPNLVVGDRALHGTQRERLARSGADVLLVDSSSVESTFAGLADVGRRVGAADAMDARLRDARAELERLRLPTPTPTLLLFGTPGSFLVISERTWLGDLAARVGLVNVGVAATGREQHPGFVEVSDEVLSGLRPELVLLVAHGDPEAIRAAFLRKLDDGAPWSGLRGGARRGVHVLPGAEFSTNPGLRMPEAARRLRELASP
jgi:iron complex transport system substrate-binding protein